MSRYLIGIRQYEGTIVNPIQKYEQKNIGANADQVIFSTVDTTVFAAAEAQEIFVDYSLEVRRAVIKAMREISIANAERWAQMAVDETKMGRVDDKIMHHSNAGGRRYVFASLHR